MSKHVQSIKRYLWVPLVCAILATVLGFFIMRIVHQTYQASAVLLVEAGAPGTNVNSITTPEDPTKSFGEASSYAAEIQSNSVMNFVYTSDPAVARQGYTAAYLEEHTTTSTSTTTPTFTVSVSAPNADDAAMLVNSVAHNFVKYVQQRAQNRLMTLRNDLQTQIIQLQRQAGAQPTPAQTNAIAALQQQLSQLPTTVNSDVTVNQEATAKGAVTSAKGTTVIAATAGVGLFVGLLLMALLIYLDNRLQSDEQVGEKLGFAYLGGLSQNDTFGTSPVQLSGKGLQEIVDICAGLRLTRVLSSQWRAPAGVTLLVTSARSGEGKTAVTAALAAAAGRSGFTVLAVDGNLRSPSLHLAFRMGATGFGLSNLLKVGAEEKVDLAVQPSPVTNVWLLQAGTATDESALLLERRLPGVLKQLRKKVDLIIIDSPPVLHGADAGVLSSLVDGVALVVDSRHAKIPLLMRAREVLLTGQSSPSHIGVILNRVAGRKHRYYAAAGAGGAQAMPAQAAVSHALLSEGYSGPSLARVTGETVTPNPPSLAYKPSGSLLPPFVRSLPTTTDRTRSHNR